MTARRPPASLLAEAGMAMVGASMMIRLVPFRLLARQMGVARGSGIARKAEITDIRRAISAWSRRLPWRTMCFEKGLTAHWMLRRRGLASTLYYGAATIDGVLKAHVWVRSGEMDVMGCENADDYALLASFPDR